MSGCYRRTWFADLCLRDGTPVCVEYSWDDAACIEDAWLKADENDANAPRLDLNDDERSRLEIELSEKGNPADEDGESDWL